MTTTLETLRPEALETLAQVIGDYFSGSEITRLFNRSGYPEIVHDGGTKWRFVSATFESLQQRGSGIPNHVLKVILTACNPQGWINKRDQFENLLHAINEVLAFYGLTINEEGNLLKTGEKASTVRQTKSADECEFEARTFHPEIIKHGRSHFCRGAYFHAVFECCKTFDSAVRKNACSERSGHALMGEAFNINGPIKLNSQQTQSEKDEQQGIMYLCMGLMNAIRNPQAHEPELNWPMSKEDALDVLALVSFLFRKLERALVSLPGSSTARDVAL
jgi:uncharacterized protein (TIGR02391 family)